MKKIQVSKTALDADVVHKTGAEVVSGIKTFTSSPKVPTLLTSSNDTSAASTSWVKTLLNSAAVAIPDVSSQVSVSVATVFSGYTAPSNGIVRFVFNMTDGYSYDITINGVSVYAMWARSYGGHCGNMWFPVKKSDVIKCTASNRMVVSGANFIPFTTI